MTLPKDHSAPAKVGGRLAAAIGAVLAGPSMASTVVTYPFRGVTHYERTEEAGAVVPRRIVMHLLEVDLTDPTIGMVLTPGNGDAPGEVNGQTTRQFVTSVGAQIGVNGNLWSLADPSTGPNGELYRTVNAISVVEGNRVSPWEGGGFTLLGGINFSTAMVATMVQPTSPSSTNYTTVPSISAYNLIGSRERMIQNGTVVATNADLHPRTCIGFTGSTMYLFTVDGRQPGYSEGMTLVEIANFLKSEYGVANLVNLDGGGSTTLVFADPTPRVLNIPSDGNERTVANNVGLRATRMQEWKVDAGGNWGTSTNWNGGVPNAPGAAARFGAAINAPRTVTLNVAATAAMLLFDNSTAGYTLAGTQSITLDATAGNAVVKVVRGSHSIAAPLSLAENTNFEVASSSTLNLNGTFTSPSARTINKLGGGHLRVGGMQSHASGTALNVNGGSIELAANLGTVSAATVALRLNAGTAQISAPQNLTLLTMLSPAAAFVTAGGGNTFKTGGITMPVGTTLDLADNHLIVDYTGVSAAGSWNGSAYTDVSGLIARGRGTGAWNGAGIRSASAASAGGLTALGIAEASQVLGFSGTATTIWSGQIVDATSALVMYTYAGDANLDGKIDIDDYGRIDASVGLGIAGWFNGDFNYDGKINVDDYGIIDVNVGVQGTPLAGTAPVARLPEASAVPEPASLSLICVSLVLLPRRRKSGPPRHF